MILEGILKIAVDEIQATATETAAKTDTAVRAILVPVIETERNWKHIWMGVGIGAGVAVVVLSLILAFGG